MIRQNV